MNVSFDAIFLPIFGASFLMCQLALLEVTTVAIRLAVTPMVAMFILVHWGLAKLVPD